MKARKKTEKEDKKRIKIFISHSQKDRVVAIEFKRMFEDFEKLYPGKQEVFLSSDLTNDQIKTGQWKTDFEAHLKTSSHFVVLVTPNSLHSTWVTYEIGYALALGIDIIPIGIRGASPEAFFLNSYNMQIIKEEHDVIKLLNRIFGTTEKFNRIWCKENEEAIGKLLLLCKSRCVYFVGSMPKNQLGEGLWNDEDQSFVERFLKQLTKSLLENGIKVSSFPSVPFVGSVVLDAAMDARLHGKESLMNDEGELSRKYEIAGLYQFDNILRLAEEKKISPEAWKKTLDDFRELYLKNKSSMVIIGGNEHTNEEYQVAKERVRQLEVFPIRCLGGFAEKQFNEDINSYERIHHPCAKCDEYERRGIKQCNHIEDFVKRLGSYIHIDEDERESQ